MKKLWFSLMILPVFLAACSTMSTNSDWDKNANFSALKTYDWVSGHQEKSTNPRLNSDLLNTRIRTAIDNTLQAKGYQKATGGNPDFWVSYSTSIEQKMDATTFSTPYAIPYGVGPGFSHQARGYWGYHDTETFVTQYDEGTLLIDIADANTKKLIWRGSVSDVIDPNATPEKREARINAAVAEALKKFPPNSK
jgi:hypothetical protein